MAKAKRPAARQAKTEAGFGSKFDLDKVIPPKYQTLSSIILIILLFLIFLSPMYFGNKTFESGDIVTSKSMTTYVHTDEENYTLWNPYIFGGMPAHALSVGYKWFNLIYVGITTLRDIFTAPFAVEYTMWTFYLILLGITGYLFMKYKTGNTLVSLFTAIMLSFSTGLIVFLYIGHVTKLTAICMFPLIFLLLLKFQHKIKLLDIALLIIALQLLVQGWHVQIIFYTLLAVGFYYVYYLISSLYRKDKPASMQLLKSGGIFVAAAVIALLIQSDNFTQIYNYTPYSTRGTKSILETEGGQVKQTESMFYDYATDYSFSPGEVFTFIVASHYGFGNSTYKGPLTGGQEYRINTYFGQMRFVDVPMYMGVLVFFLALFAMFTQWKDRFVRFLTILTVFSLLVSFGRTFSPVYDLMFYYFPFFDKFRVPSMILVLLQLSFPILAGFGLMKIISLRIEKNIKTENLVKYAAYVFSGLFVISLIMNSAIRDWFVSRIIDSPKYSDNLKQLSEYMSDMYMSDVYFAFGLTALLFWAAFAYINSRLSRDIFIISAIVLSLIDLWRIDGRAASYTSNQDIDNVFRAPEYVNIVKKQNDKEPFRILNMKQDGSYGSLTHHSNYHAYFLLQDIFGYSGIKPRAYQDYMDVLGGAPLNPTLWRMANVKYVITDRPIAYPGLSLVDSAAQSYVYNYREVLPRAYFVNKVDTKAGLDLLNMVKFNQFDPKEAAYLEKETLKADAPDSTAYVRITNYDDELIQMDVNASGNNFLFLGDTYYPNGWKATIDGKETQIYRTNHAFRGIMVPKGTHKVEFIYHPESFYISMYIELILSALVILMLVFGIYLEFRNKRKKEEVLVSA